METYRSISGATYRGDQQNMPWCKILYYELKDRCGEPYEGKIKILSHFELFLRSLDS